MLSGPLKWLVFVVKVEQRNKESIPGKKLVTSCINLFSAVSVCHTNWICSRSVTFPVPIKFNPAPWCSHTYIWKSQSTEESVFDYASRCIGVSYIYCSLPLQAASGRLKIFPHNPQTPRRADTAPVARMKCVHVTLMGKVSAVRRSSAYNHSKAGTA